MSYLRSDCKAASEASIKGSFTIFCPATCSAVPEYHRGHRVVHLYIADLGNTSFLGRREQSTGPKSWLSRQRYNVPRLNQLSRYPPERMPYLRAPRLIRASFNRKIRPGKSSVERPSWVTTFHRARQRLLPTAWIHAADTSQLPKGIAEMRPVCQ